MLAGRLPDDLMHAIFGSRGRGTFALEDFVVSMALSTEVSADR